MGDSKNNQIELVKKISIPKYFDEIIIPEMEGYYSDYTVNFEVKPVAKCPLHAEDTPSFRWYEETNTFFCFGCQAGGDVIHLHRKFIDKVNGKEPTFKESVHFLYDRFVKGLESTALIDNKESKVEYKSSIAEQLLLSNYISRLEKKMMSDAGKTIKDKLRVYNAIDIIKTLASLNKINARDGIEYIKAIVQTA